MNLAMKASTLHTQLAKVLIARNIGAAINWHIEIFSL